MATTTPNFGWPVPTSTDLVKDGATAIEALGDSIDASLVDLKGGTTGQVLSKNSNTDMDFTWVTDAAGDITGVTAGIGISGGGTSGTVTVTNSMATEIDAKGDLIAGTGADTFSRLAVGTNNQVLTADSSTATGLKWATPAAGGGGKVLQVVNATYGTAVTSSSNTYADTGLTATITPSAATSKILILINQNGIQKSNANASTRLQLRIMRDATAIHTLGTRFLYTNSTLELVAGTASTSYLDTPSTTSAITYKTQFGSTGSDASVSVQANSSENSTITLLEIGA